MRVKTSVEIMKDRNSHLCLVCLKLTIFCSKIPPGGLKVSYSYLCNGWRRYIDRAAAVPFPFFLVNLCLNFSFSLFFVVLSLNHIPDDLWVLHLYDETVGVEWIENHTWYLSQTPQTCLCKKILHGVNVYRFNAKNWHFRQILREKVAFFYRFNAKNWRFSV